MPPKRRRRFQGLYYHSSPPKVMPMNGKEANQISRRRRDADDFSVKLSTIRIWMHEKDIGKLTRILWAGQGHRLCQQASNNARIKRFLAAVPHVMNEIKDVHQAVIDNNLETLVAKLEAPVPSALVQCKDANGLNIIHKAAGLGHTKILEHIIGIWPEGVHETDVTGKTPLHWAASAKNNMRCYTLLTQAGCDEEALDYKMKTPSYYRHKPHEIERAFLVYVPEAPRVSPDSTTDWEALNGDDSVGGEIKKLDIKLPETNGVSDKSMGDSIENTSELDLQDGVSAHEEEEASEVEKPATPPATPEPEAEVEEPETESNVEESEVVENGVESDSNNLSDVKAQAEDEPTGGVDDDNVENGEEQAAVEEAQSENVDVKVDNMENEAVEQESNEEIKQEVDDAHDSAAEHEEVANADENENEVKEVDVNDVETDKTEVDVVEETNMAAEKEEPELEDENEVAEKADDELEMETETEKVEVLKTDEKNQKKKHKENQHDDDEDDDDEDVISSNGINANDNQNEGSHHNSNNNHKNHNGYGNHDNNNGDDDDADAEVDAGSPTSSLAIEGFVQGESEDNTVQSQTAAYVDEDARIRQVIESGDMEQLADIVLNGDGSKLLGMKSQNMEIQAFLNNVPTYMSKIHRVHDAARDGSLLTLQQALDRRKFAIAKDEISPNGATPLHVAVLFGNVDIVRYLAGRFPETMTATDNDERTPLHYAATIKDNGHFYNILLQLGADPKSRDKHGHTPEYFFDHPIDKDILNYKQLLSSFGAEELENELLCDQVPDDLHSARRELQEGEISLALERCFSVIYESSKMLSGTTPSALRQRKSLSASSLQLTVTSYLSRFLRRSVYDKIKNRQTRLDHNLFDVLWPAMRKTSKARSLEEDINCGIIAPDYDVFVVFQEFLVPLLKDIHCLSIDQDFKPQPRIAYFPMENGERLNTAAFAFDDESHLVTRCIVECSRNLDQMELPLNLTIGQIEQTERIMMGKIFTTAFAEAIGESESGSYYTLTEILEENSEAMVMLSNLGLMIPMLDTKDLVQAAESTAFNGTLWPYGRGVYVNSENNLALWLNCQEHLRVISTTNNKEPADMGAAYTRVGRAVCYLETQLHFKESYLLGYLQSRPAYLGTGLKMTTIVKLPNLMKEMDNLRHLCSVRGLSLISNNLSKFNVRLVNMQSMGTVEYVLFQDYCTAVTNILSLEKDMSLTNSKHIATMLVKIFRRKKNSLVDRN